jgi:parvulin-like peptidyl-prolyl isomerase
MLSGLNRRFNRIKLLNLISLLGVILIICFFIGTGCSQPDDKVLAIVGDYEITSDQFERRYLDYIVASGVDDNIKVRKSILDNMINEILLKNYDDNKNIYENEEYQKEKEWLYKQALLAFLKDREVYGNITVSEKEIREAFIKMNQTLTARHLYAKTKEEADQLYQLLQAGASFQTLAKHVFTDSTLRNNGGYLGSFTWGDMDPTFEDTAYTLEVGEISKPVKTRTGYSIIKLEDKSYNPILTEYQYQQKKSHILTTIKIRKKKPSESSYIESLFDKEALKINDDAVDEMFSLLSMSGFNPETDKQYDNKLIATYKNEEYYTDDILEKIENLPEYHREQISSPGAIKIAIEGFVAQEKLLEEAEDKGYDKSEIMLETYETMLNNLYLKYKLMEVAQKTVVEDSLLKKYYDENIDFFSTHDEINIQEIIVKDKKLADRLLSRIEKGEDFGRLAEQYSLREWSAKNSGEIGFAPLSKFGILKSIFWNASVGELIGPREIDGYFCLFKILGKKESKPIEYDSIRSEVLKVFREDRQPQLLQKHINELRSNVNVEVRENVLGSLNISLLN